jgi:hypothetical protein
MFCVAAIWNTNICTRKFGSLEPGKLSAFLGFQEIEKL